MGTNIIVPRDSLFDAAAVLCWVCDALANESDGHVSHTRDIALRGLRRAQAALSLDSTVKERVRSVNNRPAVPIIGLCGYARSGKDTAAKGLIDAGWKRVAFADALKQDIEALVLGARLAGDPIALQRSFSLACPYVKEMARPLLVEYGRLMRGIDPGHWIWRAQRAVESLGPEARGVVITDVRYANEAKWIHSIGGRVVMISRPPRLEPESPKDDYSGATPANEEEARSIPEIDFDYHIVNDMTPDDLQQALCGYAEAAWPASARRPATHDTPCP